MRRTRAAGDPDAQARAITIPCSWDDRAAAALASLIPGDGPVSLAVTAAPWLNAIARRCASADPETDLACRIGDLLCALRAAPTEAVWRGDFTAPGFVLNLAAFHTPGQGFDVDGFADAAFATACACKHLAPEAPAYAISIAGLDDLLASLGFAYDSKAARSTAGALAALFRARVEQALESDQRDLLAAPADWPVSPKCPVPGLTEAAESARRAVSRAPGARQATCITTAGAPEALLGIETGGIAPAFSPVRDGALSRAAQNRLACAAMSPEAALAATLLGETPLPIACLAAHAAMHDAVAPFIQAIPAHPSALPAPEASAAQPADRREHRGELPPRHRGLFQKASLAGHRVFLRTGEYADGSLGEIDIALPRETGALRGLMEAFSHSVSLGLQHGVKLESFVEAFALTRFGPAGLVEGDPTIAQASSVLDYVFRTLAATYLARNIPDPPVDIATAPAPLLPLDLPTEARRRNLRLVA